MAKSLKIEKLTDREHIQRRPSMYIGGIASEETTEFSLQHGNQMRLETLSYPPGLVKIINEVIDNSIDAILKTGIGSYVKVNISDVFVSVEDDSSGFPLKQHEEDQEPLVLALGNARAGSNFNDADNIGQMGTNGVGAFATNCFSNTFKATAVTKLPDSRSHLRVDAMWEDGLLVSSESTKIGKAQSGTFVSFEPNLERFGLTEIPADVRRAIFTRLAMLAYTYPDIHFAFNSVLINPPKKITDWFETQVGDGEEAQDLPIVEYHNDDYQAFIVARPDSQPNFSFVNGLNIKDGGTHVDVIMGDIARALGNIRGAEVSKADIMNTLQLIFVGKRFKNLRFNSQTKEKITNSAAETREYLGDFSALITRITKSKEIKDFVKATAQARELRANKAKIRAAKKAKIKSEKFYDAQKQRRVLMLVEGDSALGGLMPALGRENIAYYALKGKPLNAWSASTSKLTANKELSELLNIIHNSDFDKVVFGTDQDLDGFHIRGLLLGFFAKYLPEMLDKIYFLQTPVRGVMKNGSLARWSFNLHDDLKISKGEQPQYYKGLGSWDREDLKQVIDSEGLDKLLQPILVDSTDVAHTKMLESWLGDKSDDRKAFILANKFSIARI